MPRVTWTERRLGVFSEKLTLEVDDDRQLMIKCRPMFEKELKKALREIKDEARQIVRRNHSKPDRDGKPRTGKLRRSIHVGDVKLLPGGQRISGTVTAGSRLAPYAWYVHEGWGERAGKGGKYKIEPKVRRRGGRRSAALEFWMPKTPQVTIIRRVKQKARGGTFGWDMIPETIGGGPGVGNVRKVMHPGYKGDPFLHTAAIRVVRKYGGARKQRDGTWIR